MNDYSTHIYENKKNIYRGCQLFVYKKNIMHNLKAEVELTTVSECMNETVEILMWNIIFKHIDQKT